MNTKTITTAEGKSVDTAWWEVENPDGPVTVEISAQFGATQCNGRMPIGAIDRPPVALTQEGLQAELDAMRQKLADLAVGQESARNILPNLK